jgi:hypothetical protein
MGLGLQFPDDAVPVNDQIGPFTNLQPTLYWSHVPNRTGFETFSFSTGVMFTNTGNNYMAVLPMVSGPISGCNDLVPNGNKLVSYCAGQAVWDPINNGVTWAADADLPVSHPFGLTQISSAGRMDHQTATEWIRRMNRGTGYLGSNQWHLPRASSTKKVPYSMEQLYKKLGYTAGESVYLNTQHTGPFKNVQPFLYWSCERDAQLDTLAPCSTNTPAPGYEWSFSFSSGYVDTDESGANNSKALYVIPYYRDPSPYAGFYTFNGARGVDGTLLCLDVYADNLQAGTGFDSADCNLTDAQKFVINSDNVGDYVSISPAVNPGLCMAVQNDSFVDGNPIVLAACNQNDVGQWWLFSTTSTQDSLGAFLYEPVVESFNTSYCLDVHFADMRNGAQVDLATCNGTNAQNFRRFFPL